MGTLWQQRATLAFHLFQARFRNLGSIPGSAERAQPSVGCECLGLGLAVVEKKTPYARGINPATFAFLRFRRGLVRLCPSDLSVGLDYTGDRRL